MLDMDKEYIPKTVGELWDMLGMLMLSSPRFDDGDSDPLGQTVDSVFFVLKESLKHLRSKFGEERYAQLDMLADRMRADFEADPKDDNGRARAGRELIHEMEDIIRSWRAARRGNAKTKSPVN